MSVLEIWGAEYQEQVTWKFHVVLKSDCCFLRFSSCEISIAYKWFHVSDLILFLNVYRMLCSSGLRVRHLCGPFVRESVFLWL